MKSYIFIGLCAQFQFCFLTKLAFLPIFVLLCKVLKIREFVAALQKNGMKKIDAMWMASEQFACTYEYVRKCMYYYTDVNL